jgi:hypothetical protein
MDLIISSYTFSIDDTQIYNSDDYVDWREIYKEIRISEQTNATSLIQKWWRALKQQDKDWKTLQRLKIKRELEYLPPFGNNFPGGTKYREGNQRFNALNIG